jgi:hypothetical protein
LIIPTCPTYFWIGFPVGLASETNPIDDRILNLCDSAEVVASDHPYHRSMSPEEIIEELRNNAGTAFEPMVTEGFVNLVKQRGNSFSVNSSRPVTEQYVASILVHYHLEPQESNMAYLLGTGDLVLMCTISNSANVEEPVPPEPVCLNNLPPILIAHHATATFPGDWLLEVSLETMELIANLQLNGSLAYSRSASEMDKIFSIWPIYKAPLSISVSASSFSTEFGLRSNSIMVSIFSRVLLFRKK